MAISQKTFVANKKGLFDVAQSEGLIDDDYALELQNARVSVNGEVSKRRGRTKLNSTAFSGTPTINTVTVFEGDFIDSYEILASGGIDLRRYNSSTGGFDIIETALTSGKKFSTAHFKGFIVLTNGADTPFKYGYVGKTVTPVTGETSSGSLSARTYFVKTTYVSSQIDQHCIASDSNRNVGDVSANTYVSQTFTAGSTASIDRLRLRVKRVGNLSDNLLVSIRATDGSGVPTGSDLTNQVSLALSSLKTEYEWKEIVFTTYASLTASTKYAIIIKRSGSNDASNYIQISEDSNASYAGGNVYISSDAATWASDTSKDIDFITYLLSGESKPSEQKTQSMTANNVLTLTSPNTTDGATAYNVYISETSGAEVKQNSKPVPIGTNFQENDSGLGSLGALPTAYTSWYTKPLSEIADNGFPKYVFSLNGRLFFSGFEDQQLKIIGSAVDNEHDYTTASDSAEIDLGSLVTRGDKIVGLSRFGVTNELIIALQNHFVLYSVPTVHANFVARDVIFNIGVMSHRAIVEVPTRRADNFILGREGLNSINVEVLTGGLGTNKLSDQIKDRLVPILQAVTDPSEITATNYKFENEYILSIPSVNKRFIYNYELKSWMEDRAITVYDMAVTPDGFLLSAGAGGFIYREYQNDSRVNVYGDGNNDSNISFQWDTPWLRIDGPDIKKIFKYFQFKGTGGGVFQMQVFYDYDTTAYKTIYLQSDPSLWDETTSEWDGTYWDFPDINKVLIPLIGRGRVVKFSFTAEHQNPLTISYYGVKYKRGGYRSND